VKRLPLSLNIAPASKAALLARAEREGHRYPAVLAATLLERALRGADGETSADPGVAADVAKDLTACAQKLRARGAVPADRVESLASALDELAGRLGGSVVLGGAMDEDEAQSVDTPARGPGGPTPLWGGADLHLTSCGTAYRGCDPACPLDRERRDNEERGGAR
jgi:hypothetical protein